MGVKEDACPKCILGKIRASYSGPFFILGKTIHVLGRRIHMLIKIGTDDVAIISDIAYALRAEIKEDGKLYSKDFDWAAVEAMCKIHSVDFERVGDECLTITVGVFTDRHWRAKYFGSYSYEWVSTHGDVLEARFERSPLLNGKELPQYGEDLEEILDGNSEFISEHSLLKDEVLPSCPCCGHMFTAIAEEEDHDRHGNFLWSYSVNVEDTIYHCLACYEFSVGGSRSLRSLEAEYWEEIHREIAAHDARMALLPEVE